MYLPIIPVKRLISLVCSIITSFSFQCCEAELEECFFIGDNQKSRSFDLLYFNQIVSHLPGEYTIKQADYHRIEVTGHQYYIDSLATVVTEKKHFFTTLFHFAKNTQTFPLPFT